MRGLLIAVMFLASCTMQADVERTGATMQCVDTRDGEKFSFNDTSVKDVVYGIGADSCFTATDDKGRERRLCKAHEKFLKCEKAPPNP